MTSRERIELLTDLFREHYGLIVAAVRRYAPNEEQLEDIAQQVYLDFVFGKNLEQWDLRQDVSPLLFQMAKRKAQTLWRKRREKNGRPLDTMVDRLQAQDDRGDWESELRKVKALEHCLELLPPKSRDYVQRHYYQGLSIKTIGEEEKMTPSSVYRFFRNVRLQLKECIKRKLQVSDDE